MYTVYIRNYLSWNQYGTSIITTDHEMLSIPSDEDFPVSNPSVKSSEDAADNFSFTMEAKSPYYSALLPLKTLIRVEYDGDTIFYGRVMDISTSTAYQTKSVTCEGWYSFLNDSLYEGKPDKNRRNITVDAYLTNIINNHNAAVPAKQIRRGTVGVTLPTDPYKYEPSSWTQSSSLISNLANNHGGHFKMRYVGAETPYLDWYKYYARDLGDGVRPSVTVGRNIVDISSEQNPDDLFTRVIPIGDSSNSSGLPIYVDGYTYTDKDGNSHTHSGKAIPISLIRTLYSDAQLTDDFHNASDYTDAETNFGVLYKTVSFSDANTQEKLWNYAKQWIKECYFGLASSFTIKAIDLHILDQTVPKILLGDCVDVRYPITENGVKIWKTKKLVCKSVQYDLFNPDNNSYTFGVPTDLLEHNRENKKSSGAKTASNAAGGGGGIGGGEEEPVTTWHSIWNMIGARDDGAPAYGGVAAYDSFGANGQLSGKVMCYDPQELVDGKTIAQIKFTAMLVGKMTNTSPTKWVAVSEDRGVFAYMTTDGFVYPVSFWYTRKKCKYGEDEPDVSTFEKIAKMIESCGDSTFGGPTIAERFRQNGEFNGTFKCFDPRDVDMTQPVVKSKIFNGSVIGKIGNIGQYSNVFVGTSSEYGTFAYTQNRGPNTYRGYFMAVYWYVKARGTSYGGGAGGFISEENGDVFSTSDGSPDGTKTVFMKTKALTGNGDHQGQILVGYDLKGSEDKWCIELNVPVEYTDQDGETRVADGFVRASDFSVEEIPSFKTRMIIADLAIFGTVEANDGIINRLNSAEASIEGKLDTNSLSSAFTNLGTARINILAAGSVSADTVTIGSNSESGGTNIANAISNLQIVPVAGTNTYQLQAMRFNSSNWSNFGDPFERAATPTIETWYSGNSLPSNNYAQFTVKVGETSYVGSFHLDISEGTKAYTISVRDSNNVARLQRTITKPSST